MPVDVEQQVRRLEAAVDDVLRLAQNAPLAALHADPGGDDWSVMKVLAHLAELLPYWSRQAREVAARDLDNQPFGRTHEDPDRIAAVEDHAHDTLEMVVPRVRAGRDEAVATIRGLDARGWARTARHARRGEMSVEQFVGEFLVSHAEEHARQAADALARVA